MRESKGLKARLREHEPLATEFLEINSPLRGA
jgi:hypothetical protein